MNQQFCSEALTDTQRDLLKDFQSVASLLVAEDLNGVLHLSVLPLLGTEESESMALLQALLGHFQTLKALGARLKATRCRTALNTLRIPTAPPAVLH